MNKYTGLDPLSTIIKLAIIGTKPVGTKIYIHKNTIAIHEPGITQPFIRYMKRATKNDIHLLYQAIEYACCEFLCDSYETTTTITQIPAFGSSTIRRKSLTPRQMLPGLFKGAIRGLEKLKQTYQSFPVISICLQYYISIIIQYMQNENKTIPINPHPTLNLLNERWTGNKIQQATENYSRIDADYKLELFMKEIDRETRTLCMK
jgi:hypothetical protein